MTILNVLKMGHEILNHQSKPVINFNDPMLVNIIQNMIDTMNANGGVGIAAPQVGYDLRIVIFGFDKNPRYPDEKPVPLTILLNPEIKTLSDELEDGWEGCLSVPGLRGLVPRHKFISYSGYDHMGKKIQRDVDGFHARVVQHELDHLNGILYPEKIKDLKYFGFEDSINFNSL